MPLRKSHLVIIIAVLLLIILLSSAHLASQILIPSMVEKNGKTLLGVPTSVERGGINFLNATVWLEGLEVGNVPGSRERIFLSIKRLEINLSFTSFLANEFIVEEVRLINPVLNLERDPRGNLNSDVLGHRFKQLFRPQIRIGKFEFFQRYAIQHFSIKSGTVRHLNHNALPEQREWVFRDIDFSFSEFNYPPRPNSPATTSFYLSSKLTGREEGKIRISGTGIFLSNNKNFKIKSSFQNIALRDVNSLNSVPTQAGIAGGFTDIDSVFYCENNQLKIDNQIKLRNVVIPETNGKKADEIVFGFSRKTLSQFFTLMNDKPFEFDFSVSGNLGDPSFDLKQELANSFFTSAHEKLDKSIDRLNADSLKQVEKFVTGGKAEAKPADLLKQLVDRFSQQSQKSSSKNPAL